MTDAPLLETRTEPGSGPWYESVGPAARLMQGDVILRCPLLTWAGAITVAPGGDETEVLRGASRAFVADVVVMTQACDLEQEKVANVVLCPHLSLADYKAAWEEALLGKGQNPTLKAWRGHCDDIKDGYLWNLSLLNSYEDEALGLDLRVVDFHELFTVPRLFLESLLAERGQSRLRLCPPYREHLSQAFARYFMRVGLPTPIQATW